MWQKSNVIIPLRISIALLCLKHCTTELPIGLCCCVKTMFLTDVKYFWTHFVTCCQAGIQQVWLRSPDRFSLRVARGLSTRLVWIKARFQEMVAVLIALSWMVGSVMQCSALHCGGKLPAMFNLCIYFYSRLHECHNRDVNFPLNQNHDHPFCCLTPRCLSNSSWCTPSPKSPVAS